MIDIETISIIVGIFVGLSTLIAGSGFAYAQYKTGGDKAKDDLIETLKDTAIAEKSEKERLATEKAELFISHQQQITQLTKELSELKGRFEEQNKKTEEYKELLQGKDPKQLEYMKEMKEMAKMAVEYITTTKPILQKLAEEYNTKHPGEKDMRVT